ncbi:mCG1027449, partial [Mus musculus]
GRTAGSPRGRASPQQSPPGPAHPQASRSLAELQTRVAPARRKERELLRTAARSQKPVWWVNTALERPWIQQGFPSLMPGWRT